MNNSSETANDIEARLNRLCAEDVTQFNDSSEPAFDAPTLSEPVSPMSDPTVNQWIVRSQHLDDGQSVDTFSGSFRCPLQTSQTVYVLHVPIYPPMDSLPTAEVHCDHPNVTAKVTEAKKFGLRIELKRSVGPAPLEAALVEINATCVSPSSQAAKTKNTSK